MTANKFLFVFLWDPYRDPYRDTLLTTSLNGASTCGKVGIGAKQWNSRLLCFLAWEICCEIFYQPCHWWGGGLSREMCSRLRPWWSRPCCTKSAPGSVIFGAGSVNCGAGCGSSRVHNRRPPHCGTRSQRGRSSAAHRRNAPLRGALDQGHKKPTTLCQPTTSSGPT